MSNEYHDNKKDIERREPLRPVVIDDLENERQWLIKQRSAPEKSQTYTPGGNVEQYVHQKANVEREKRINDIENMLKQKREQSRDMRRKFNRDDRE